LILRLSPLLLAASLLQAPPTPRLDVPATILAGERPHIRASGLVPFSPVTLESFRVSTVAAKADGRWSSRPTTFHAEASFWADASGAVDLDQAAPITGTYSGVDPRGLLWSGVAGADTAAPEYAGLQPGEVRLALRLGGGRALAYQGLRIEPYRAGVAFTTVDTPGLVGVFAAPTAARGAPTVILLHGSEGGDFDAAKAQAGLWASHGYAAFALIYFSWPYAHVPNAPQGFAGLPLERIGAVRAWLAARPEADVTRLGVAGGSKGAEFALLAASRYPWIRAVAACVPSSLAWGGFGLPGKLHPHAFTWGGQPLAEVPYGDYGPVERGEITSAERHRRDRDAAGPAAVAAATIPVERSRARLLLISGGRDAVWPSDAMSAEIVARMRRAGLGQRVTWRSFPDAGHYLCGVGDGPIRANETDEAARGGGLVPADGRDPGEAWQATLDFMDSVLARPS
jgi:hypothetical protein